MTKTSPTGVAALVLAVLACGYRASSVPVVGPAPDVGALAGQWQGEYSSAETGRSGTISFTLTAGGDSAFGEVVMVPEGFGRPLRPWDDPNRAGGPRPTAEVLTIRFVRVEGDRVAGTLAPYADPQTGTPLLTSFEGRIGGNAIEGTYTTRPAQSSVTQAGRWRVVRVTPSR
jgi:hypothetical protein